MAQIDPQELGNRLRAARGYAGGKSQPWLAKALSTSHSSVKRLEAGGGADELKIETVISRAAEACGLPRGFFTQDFALLDAAKWEGKTMPTRDQVLAAEGLMTMLTELISAASEQTPQEELRQRLEGAVQRVRQQRGDNPGDPYGQAAEDGP